MDQVLVQNRVQNAMAQLPQSVQTQGVSIRAKSASIWNL
jgi:HAE1 family hydrophobic/amphiphilic exporter-1